MDNIDKSFKPTVQWMAEKYDEMNHQLFGGSLMECDFDVFTTGRGMEGGTLGWFCIEGKDIKIERRGRKMYKRLENNGRIYIERDNFVELCMPKIKLNGNYSGSEKSFLSTLAHEMCHYYTYMNGYAPVQAHGREFKRIGMIVSSRSNGIFTIQRLASAEQMGEMELNAEMKAKRAKRLANKKASVTALIYVEGRDTKLTITSNEYLIKTISSFKNQYKEFYASNDADVIEFLFSKGYRKNLRTWRYWIITNKPWIGELKGILNGETEEQEVEAEPEENKHPKRIFSIKTNNGVFEYDGTEYNALVKALKERFPKMSDESINKIVNNPANYRMEENKINSRRIIESVLNEFIDNEIGEDSLDIIPGSNLGLMSPMEMEYKN